MNIAEKTLQLKQDFDDVYEAGKKAEYDAFWDDFQDNGNRTLYESAFQGKGWTNNNFKPKYNMMCIGQFSCNSTFRQSLIEDIKGILERQGVVMDFSQASHLTNTFQNSMVKRLPVINLGSCIKMQSTFHTCRSLEEVEISNLQANCIFSNDFQHCGGLTKFTLTNSTIGQNGFDIHWSTKLSADSLKSIINALADKSGTGTTFTITLGTENLAKLTDAEKAIATQKGWSLA